MVESSEIENAGRRLFGTLFGFKKGQRVKIWRRVYSYWSPKDKRRGYWRYGVIKKVQTNTYDNIPRYRVRLDGDYYNSSFKAEELVRVRKYVKKDV